MCPHTDIRMKKTFATLLSCAIAVSASAIIDGDGYYRVHNAKTERYIYVLDDKGKLNFQATTAELGAIQLWKGHENTISDPSTVIYVMDLNGKKQDYDLQTQGTGVNAIIDYPVSIRMADKTKGTYSIFGRNSGLTRYIGDGTRSTAQRGYVTSLENGEYYRWYFTPLDTQNNYFGITPEFEDGGEYYATLYADFPFTFYSDGMKAYYVQAVADGKAYIKEIEGTVAKGTPVIVKASAATASGNRLNIGGSGRPVTGSMLKGVYFCNDDDVIHYNLTDYDKKTMRVLGRLSDGSIGFTTADIKYLPRNKAYLVVPEGTPPELHLSTDTPAGIAEAEISTATVRVNGRTLYVFGAENAEIYNITGNRIASLSDAAAGASITLPAAGLYLVKTGSTVTKILAQ